MPTHPIDRERIAAIHWIQYNRYGNMTSYIPIALSDFHPLTDAQGNIPEPPLPAAQIVVNGATYLVPAHEIEIPYKAREESR